VGSESGTSCPVDAAAPANINPLRAAIYVRVGTADQNCELQLRELHDHAAQRGWPVVDIYQDVMSGAKAHPPALTALMNDARAKKLDYLLVRKLDRFRRSLADCLNRIRDLETDGVRFVATTQGLDTDQRNPVSRLLLHVPGAAAEFQRSLILERSRAGQSTCIEKDGAFTSACEPRSRMPLTGAMGTRTRACGSRSATSTLGN
jgi:DNA invertase Pin-like site-specific DNA recombinase